MFSRRFSSDLDYSLLANELFSNRHGDAVGFRADSSDQIMFGLNAEGFVVVPLVFVPSIAIQEENFL